MLLCLSQVHVVPWYLHSSVTRCATYSTIHVSQVRDILDRSQAALVTPSNSAQGSHLWASSPPASPANVPLPALKPRSGPGGPAEGALHGSAVPQVKPLTESSIRHQSSQGRNESSWTMLHDPQSACIPVQVTLPCLTALPSSLGPRSYMQSYATSKPGLS